MAYSTVPYPMTSSDFSVVSFITFCVSRIDDAKCIVVTRVCECVCVCLSAAVHYWHYCTALEQRPSAKLCGVVITELSQTAPRIFGRAVITLGIGPHSSLI